MENNALQQFLIRWKWRTTKDQFVPLTCMRINFVNYRFRKGGLTFDEQTKLLEWLSEPENANFNHNNIVRFFISNEIPAKMEWIWQKDVPILKNISAILHCRYVTKYMAKTLRKVK